MALLRRLHTIRSLYRKVEVREFPYLIGSSRSYSSSAANGDFAFPFFWAPKINCGAIYSCNYKDHNVFPWIHGGTMTLRSTMVALFSASLNDTKSFSTQAKAPAQARKMGALKVAMLSPGFIYEPYAPRESISFWKRWFTRSGWRRTKDDVIIELKSAYAIAKLRKSGYSKKKFYKEAIEFYKEINASLAHGDIKALRKATTEKMCSVLKNDIKRRESMWSQVHWEMVEPVVKIRTLRARLIGVDRNDLSKVFIQLTLEFLTKQRFEAYDSKGTVVAGDKTKEVLVRDIWVFEKSLFHPGAYWRLCGKISL